MFVKVSHGATIVGVTKFYENKKERDAAICEGQAR